MADVLYAAGFTVVLRPGVPNTDLEKATDPEVIVAAGPAFRASLGQRISRGPPKTGAARRARLRERAERELTAKHPSVASLYRALAEAGPAAGLPGDGLPPRPGGVCR